MIIECKKSSSLLLAVILLTSLNCLAMEEEERAPMSNPNYLAQDIQKPVPSARNFYTNSWRNIKSYGPPAAIGGASLVSATLNPSQLYGPNPQKIAEIGGWLGSAALTGYGQYQKRAEQQERSERGHKLWYAAPAATVVALGGLIGLTHFALASAGYIDASSYGESVWKNSLAKNLLMTTANGAMQGAFLASPFVASSGVAAFIEAVKDSKKEALDNADILAGHNDKGKEEE